MRGLYSLFGSKGMRDLRQQVKMEFHVFYCSQNQIPMNTEIPIGALIRSKLDEEGRSVFWLAKQVPCARTNIYKIFDKQDISVNMLLRISIIMRFNFFTYYLQSVDKAVENVAKMRTKCPPIGDINC